MRQPKVNLPFEPLDKFLFGVSILSAIGLILLPAINYYKLPDKIPVHFDINGVADRYGHKMELWVIPIIGIALMVLLWGISKIPHTFNYAVKITTDNAAEQYAFSVKLMRVLAAIIGFGFTFIVWEIIKAAKGNLDGLNPFFLPFFIGTIFISIGYFLNKSLKGNQTN